MHRLDLDYQSARPFPWAGAALFALAFATAVFSAIYYNALIGKIAYWEASAGRSGAADASQATSAARASSEMVLEMKHANEVLSKITLPWDRLFQAVEWSSRKDVALLGMEPNIDRNEVTITGEAKDMRAVLNYLEHLGAQDIFSSVYLRRHQVQLQDPDRPVRFTLVAAWKVAP